MDDTMDSICYIDFIQQREALIQQCQTFLADIVESYYQLGEDRDQLAYLSACTQVRIQVKKIMDNIVEDGKRNAKKTLMLEGARKQRMASKKRSESALHHNHVDNQIDSHNGPKEPAQAEELLEYSPSPNTTPEKPLASFEEARQQIQSPQQDHIIEKDQKGFASSNPLMTSSVVFWKSRQQAQEEQNVFNVPEFSPNGIESSSPQKANETEAPHIPYFNSDSFKEITENIQSQIIKVQQKRAEQVLLAQQKHDQLMQDLYSNTNTAAQPHLQVQDPIPLITNNKDLQSYLLRAQTQYISGSNPAVQSQPQGQTQFILGNNTTLRFNTQNQTSPASFTDSPIKFSKFWPAVETFKATTMELETSKPEHTK